MDRLSRPVPFMPHLVHAALKDRSRNMSLFTPRKHSFWLIPSNTAQQYQIFQDDRHLNR